MFDVFTNAEAKQIAELPVSPDCVWPATAIEPVEAALRLCQDRLTEACAQPLPQTQRQDALAVYEALEAMRRVMRNLSDPARLVTS